MRSVLPDRVRLPGEVLREHDRRADLQPASVAGQPRTLVTALPDRVGGIRRADRPVRARAGLPGGRLRRGGGPVAAISSAATTGLHERAVQPRDVGGGLKVCDVPFDDCVPLPASANTGCWAPALGCYLSTSDPSKTICDCPFHARLARTGTSARARGSASPGWSAWIRHGQGPKQCTRVCRLTVPTDCPRLRHLPHVHGNRLPVQRDVRLLSVSGAMAPRIGASRRLAGDRCPAAPAATSRTSRTAAFCAPTAVPAPRASTAPATGSAAWAGAVVWGDDAARRAAVLVGPGDRLRSDLPEPLPVRALQPGRDRADVCGAGDKKRGDLCNVNNDDCAPGNVCIKDCGDKIGRCYRFCGTASTTTTVCARAPCDLTLNDSGGNPTEHTYLRAADRDVQSRRRQHDCGDPALGCYVGPTGAPVCDCRGTSTLGGPCGPYNSCIPGFRCVSRRRHRELLQDLSHRRHRLHRARVLCDAARRRHIRLLPRLRRASGGKSAIFVPPCPPNRPRPCRASRS